MIDGQGVEIVGGGTPLGRDPWMGWAGGWGWGLNALGRSGPIDLLITGNGENGVLCYNMCFSHSEGEIAFKMGRYATMCGQLSSKGTFQ